MSDTTFNANINIKATSNLKMTLEEEARALGISARTLQATYNRNKSMNVGDMLANRKRTDEAIQQYQRQSQAAQKSGQAQSQAAQKTGQAQAQAAKATGDALTSLASRYLSVAAASTFAVQSFRTFAAQGERLRIIQARTGAVEADMRRLAATIESTSEKLGMSNQEVTDTFTALQEAGYLTVEQARLIAPAVAQAAKVFGESGAAMATGLGEFMSTLDVAAKDAPDALNMMVTAATKFRMNLGQLNLWASQLGSTMHDLGVTGTEGMGQVISMMGILKEKGFASTTRAARALIQTISQLRTGAGIAQSLGYDTESWGYAMEEAAERGQGLTFLLDRVKQARAEGVPWFKILPNPQDQRVLKAVLTDYARFQKEIREGKLTEEEAQKRLEAMLNGPQNALDRLSVSFHKLMETVGETMEGLGASKALNAIGDLLKDITSLLERGEALKKWLESKTGVPDIMHSGAIEGQVDVGGYLAEGNLKGAAAAVQYNLAIAKVKWRKGEMYGGMGADPEKLKKAEKELEEAFAELSKYPKPQFVPKSELVPETFEGRWNALPQPEAPAGAAPGAAPGSTYSRFGVGNYPPHYVGRGELPGRAGGGPTSAGRPYMVGERGPEVFVPGQGGRIDTLTQGAKNYMNYLGHYFRHYDTESMPPNILNLLPGSWPSVVRMVKRDSSPGPNQYRIRNRWRKILGLSDDEASKRALGGSILGGRDYLVGERGPEVLRAGTSGRVMPFSTEALERSEYVSSRSLDEERNQSGTLEEIRDILREMMGEGGGGAAGGGGASGGWEGGPSGIKRPGGAAQAGKGGFRPDKGGGTLGDRLNNPGNLKYGPFAKAHGATGAGPGGHAVFPDYETGRKALEALIASKGADQSIAEMGKWYAEDPNWANNVARAMGVSPDYIPRPDEIPKLADAIQRAEGTRIGGMGGGAAGAPGPGPGGLVPPVGEGGKVISTIGDPRDGVARRHMGTDFQAEMGAPIYATSKQTVTQSGWIGEKYGWGVKTVDENGREHVYAHMAEDPGLQRGQTFNGGQRIGSVGMSGNARGTVPHVHYEMRGRGGYNDPLNPLYAMGLKPGSRIAGMPKKAAENVPLPRSRPTKEPGETVADAVKQWGPDAATLWNRKIDPDAVPKNFQMGTRGWYHPSMRDWLGQGSLREGGVPEREWIAKQPRKKDIDPHKTFGGAGHYPGENYNPNTGEPYDPMAIMPMREEAALNEALAKRQEMERPIRLRSQIDYGTDTQFRRMSMRRETDREMRESRWWGIYGDIGAA